MSTYNPNDFYPSSGKEINSQGNVVTPADGINPDGSQNVVLVNRKAVEVVCHNALTIRDSLTHDSSLFDISVYDRKSVFIVNTLDQSVSVTFLVQTLSVSNAVFLVTKSIAAGQTGVISSADNVGMADPFQQAKIRVSCVTPPTTGTVTVIFEGSPK